MHFSMSFHSTKQVPTKSRSTFVMPSLYLRSTFARNNREGTMPQSGQNNRKTDDKHDTLEQQYDFALFHITGNAISICST
jgi:hypothetical protein